MVCFHHPWYDVVIGTNFERTEDKTCVLKIKNKDDKVLRPALGIQRGYHMSSSGQIFYYQPEIFYLAGILYY